MSLRPFFVALVGLGLLASATHAETGPMPREVVSYEIPYRLTDTKHVLVRLKLNGKGPFNFIIDTGAPALIMSEAVAKKLDAKSEKGWLIFDKLELEGGLVVEKAHGIATDMFQLKGMNAMGLAGVELHGVIGYNILAKYRIQYDFTEPKLVWTPTNFQVPPPKRISDADKKGGQGGLETLGDVMQVLAALGGIKANFATTPRGHLGAELEQEGKGGALVVKAVHAESPAAKAGLQVGDRIQTAQGKDAKTLETLLAAVEKLPEGSTLKLNVERGKDTKTITVTLGKGL